MSWNDAYLESKIYSADPVELVRMLYAAALNSTRSAREHLAAGQIAARSAAISKVLAILGELDGSLDHSVGGAVSQGLAELYAYMRRRLCEANLRQADAPLAETESLLATLLEAWQKVEVIPAAETHWAPLEAVSESAAQSWSA
ncbi:MAG: flagellar export chaperone FliS [Bryobacteraceae bacterium]